MEDTALQTTESLRELPPVIQEMAKTGLWYGRKTSKTNPLMREFVFTARNGIELFDLEITLAHIEKAKSALQTIVQSGGSVLVVGTTASSQSAARAFADQFNFPYVTNRWLGGTLTNFKTLSQRTRHFTKLKADRDMGRLEKYTKKERNEFDKEIGRLTQLFAGVEVMGELPKAVIILGASAHDTAIREANRMKIPIFGIANTDANPDVIQYIIPANDISRSSITWIMQMLSGAVEEGKKLQIAQQQAIVEAKNGTTAIGVK